MERPIKPAAAVTPAAKAWALVAGCVFAVVVVCGATPPPTPPPSATPSTPGVNATPQPVGSGVVQTAATGHPLDEPLRLIQKAQESYAGVRDYTCTMIKQERIGGSLTPPHVISLSMRNQPFSVAMKWVEPRNMAAQEACYVAGRNNGQMRVKSPGLLGAVGFVSIDPNDARAKKTSNHVITEAGIGNLIGRYAARWQQQRQSDKTQVQIGEYEYNQRRCTRVETTQPEQGGPSPYFRSVVYFDKENHLPIRVECYDWPRQGGSPGGELQEVYNYVNLHLNANVPDATFNR